LVEAEALRDGRLGPVERSSYQRHVSDCRACAGELEALEAFAAPLRESGAEMDELHVRRERARLLAAAATSAGSASSFEPQVGPRSSRLLAASGARGRLWAAALAAAACALVAFWVARPGEPISSAVVHADAAAVWSTRKTAEREEIVLSSGALLIHVDHHAAGQPRLRVALPDGELEDIGTIFTVSVQEGRTARVAVQEGRVVLRIRGREEIAIAAGETWTPDRASEQPAARGDEERSRVGDDRNAAPPAVDGSGAATKPSSRSHGVSATKPDAGNTAKLGGSAAAVQRAVVRDRRASLLSPQTSPAPRTSPQPLEPDPARDFRDATAAFSRGEHRATASALAAFVAHHPLDPRGEDASYLRVLALQKCCTREDVLSAARTYLQRYPDGLRRAEITRLLNEREKLRASDSTGAD
jgi:hypothetical protein